MKPFHKLTFITATKMYNRIQIAIKSFNIYISLGAIYFHRDTNCVCPLPHVLIKQLARHWFRIYVRFVFCGKAELKVSVRFCCVLAGDVPLILARRLSP